MTAPVVVKATDAEEALGLARLRAGGQPKEDWAVDGIHVTGARARILEEGQAAASSSPLPTDED